MKFAQLSDNRSMPRKAFAATTAVGMRKSGISLDMGNGGRDVQDDEFEKF
jgi:hypothetical protein